MRKRFVRHGARGFHGVRPWLGGLALALASLTAAAASSSSPLRVNVQLLPPFKDTPDCSSVKVGAAVSVSCVTPGTSLVASERYLLHVYSEGQVVQTVDTVADPGTVTSWRLLHIADRDFLEIVVGW
jgi:hypothetical protein